MTDFLSSAGSKIAQETVSTVKKTLDNLVKSEKISESKSSTIFEEIKNSLSGFSDGFEKNIAELVKKIYEKADIATPEEIQALKRRITILEKLTKNT